MGERFSNIGLIQHNIALGDPQKNQKQIIDAITSLSPESGSLIVLPELWGTGFNYEKIKEYTKDIIPLQTQLLMELSLKYQITICGSNPYLRQRKQGERIYNSSMVISNGKIIGVSDKQHLFDTWDEDKWFSKALSYENIDTENGNIAGLVCYDLRFPQTARTLCQRGADVLVFSAQWPKSRIEQWEILLKARAIENQIFVIGCNGVGDCNGMTLGGNSMIIDPTGKVLCRCDQDASNCVVKPEWFVQDEIRGRFNTVGVDIFRKKKNDQPLSTSLGVDEIRRRVACGQKVCLVKAMNADVLDLTVLSSLREEYDFLVVSIGTKREDVASLLHARCVDLVMHPPISVEVTEVLPSLVTQVNYADL